MKVAFFALRSSKLEGVTLIFPDLPADIGLFSLKRLQIRGVTFLFTKTACDRTVPGPADYRHLPTPGVWKSIVVIVEGY